MTKNLFASRTTLFSYVVDLLLVSKGRDLNLRKGWASYKTKSALTWVFSSAKDVFHLTVALDYKKMPQSATSWLLFQTILLSKKSVIFCKV